MNPLYQAMMQNLPTNNVMSLLQRFNQFRNSFRGNPQEQVQALINSGRVSQADYNRAVQMAQQMQGMLK
jgi:hypothetical protein